MTVSTSTQIPAELKPADGRFGCGPSKVRPEALAKLAEQNKPYVAKDEGARVEKGGGYTERYLKAHVAGTLNTVVRARVERVEHGEIHDTPA